MLLQRLVEYSDRLELPPPLYAKAPIRYVIELDATGHVLNPRPVDRAEAATGRGSRGAELLVPQTSFSEPVEDLFIPLDQRTQALHELRVVAHAVELGL